MSVKEFFAIQRIDWHYEWIWTGYESWSVILACGSNPLNVTGFAFKRKKTLVGKPVLQLQDLHRPTRHNIRNKEVFVKHERAPTINPPPTISMGQGVALGSRPSVISRVNQDYRGRMKVPSKNYRGRIRNYRDRI